MGNDHSPGQRVISKEDAVFWMDKNGEWHNEHGKFEHPRIIKYFNASIKKDDDGYHVSQQIGEIVEKVYFSYQDTALFVIDIQIGNEILLILNNTGHLILDPGQLFTKDDNLYLKTADHKIKFSSRALLKVSKFLKEEKGQLFFHFNDTVFPVNE